MKLPDKVLLFKKGINDTTKGQFLFDEVAAEMVLADYAKHNVQLMFDLEHMSTHPELPSYNSDAQAWADLSVEDGNLYATDVKWTPEGQDRLTKKKQRFLSPCFSTEPVEGDEAMQRITSILNVAITSMPATDNAPALVAANQLVRLNTIVLGDEIVQSSVFIHDMAKTKLAADAPVNPDAPKSPEEMAVALAELQKQLDACMEENASLKEQLAAEEDPATDDAEDVAAKEEAASKLAETEEKLTAALNKIDDMEKASVLSELSAKGIVSPAQKKLFMKLSLADVNDYAKDAKASGPKHQKVSADGDVAVEIAKPGGVRKPIVLSMSRNSEKK